MGGACVQFFFQFLDLIWYRLNQDLYICFTFCVLNPVAFRGSSLLSFLSGPWTFCAFLSTGFPEPREEGFVGEIPFRTYCSKVLAAFVCPCYLYLFHSAAKEASLIMDERNTDLYQNIIRSHFMWDGGPCQEVW